MDLTVTLLEFASILLIGIGGMFILVDLRTGFDRIFRYFGISLILVSAMAAIDLYTGGPGVPPAVKLNGQRVLHEIACVFFPFSGTYLMLIAGVRMRWAKTVLIGAGILFAPLVPTGLMLGLNGNVVEGGPLYLPLFFPYAVFYIGFSYFVLILNLARSGQGQRKFALIHLMAFIVLTLAGLMDMVGIMDPAWKMFVSYKIFGILIFGAMSAYVFTERFFLLLQERQETFSRLDVLRRQLDGADPLREIGQSAARISHEIKNYLATMKSNSLLIRMKSEDLGMRVEADRIERSTERLEAFTRSILNYASSSATVYQGRAEFCARAALDECVREFLPARAADIAVASGGGPALVRGDRAKLEQVYLNLIRNSFEAGARKVAVSFSGDAGILRIRLEDDGRGCPEAALASLGKPFYTTRKGLGGTGLGIAISRAIIEGFGGLLSYQPLRADGNGSAGMAASIELPSATPIAFRA